MASPRTTSILRDLKRGDENNRCFDCQCLDCSGKHRSLGVHISFVRSLTMDKWKDEELERMKVGGNANAARFFESQPDYRSSWTFEDKYHSKAAALLRDKIACEGRGETWSAATSAARNYVPVRVTGPSMTTTTTPSSTSTPSYNSSSKGSGDAARFGNGMTVQDVAQSRDKYFESLQSSNATRPDSLPPSQGGKYGGFGSNGAAHTMKEDDSWGSTLTSSLSALSVVGSKIAQQATELTQTINQTVIQPAAAKVQDTEFWGQVSQSLSDLGTKAVAATTEGINKVSALIDGKKTPRRSSKKVPFNAEEDFFETQNSAPVSTFSSSSTSAVSSAGSRNAAVTDEWSNDFGDEPEAGSKPASKSKKSGKAQKPADEWDEW